MLNLMVIQFSMTKIAIDMENFKKKNLIWIRCTIQNDGICDDKWKVLYLQVLFAQNMEKTRKKMQIYYAN